MCEMKPGDVRIFKGGKALVVAVGIWAKREREHLRIDVTGFGGHTTISNNPASERYHRTLFRNMRRIMIDQGVWEFGEEGAETEHRA
jgi:hypothetical protein